MLNRKQVDALRLAEGGLRDALLPLIRNGFYDYAIRAAQLAEDIRRAADVAEAAGEPAAEPPAQPPLPGLSQICSADEPPPGFDPRRAIPANPNDLF